MFRHLRPRLGFRVYCSHIRPAIFGVEGSTPRRPATLEAECDRATRFTAAGSIGSFTSAVQFRGRSIGQSSRSFLASSFWQPRLDQCQSCARSMAAVFRAEAKWSAATGYTAGILQSCFSSGLSEPSAVRSLRPRMTRLPEIPGDGARRAAAGESVFLPPTGETRQHSTAISHSASNLLLVTPGSKM